jgi:hypothetical protein
VKSGWIAVQKAWLEDRVLIGRSWLGAMSLLSQSRLNPCKHEFPFAFLINVQY